MFLQLVNFFALAAFTNNFDITNGVVDNSSDEKKLMQAQLQDFSSHSDVAASQYRSQRLPTLNARGISITMAFSRLLLMVQYVLGG